MSWADLEGLAAAFLRDARIGAPVDPWVVAWALELEVRAGPPGCRACLSGDTIFVDPLDRLVRQGFDVVHECAHPLLKYAGLPNTERNADNLASCILLPYEDFGRDVRRTDGCLFALRERHPWASHEVIARRFVSMRTAIAWVWDREPRQRRYSIVTPGYRWQRREPTEPELDAMLGALESGVPVESIGGVRAWPICEPGYERVISVADIDVLTAYV